MLCLNPHGDFRLPNHEHACENPHRWRPRPSQRRGGQAAGPRAATSTTWSAKACGTEPLCAAPFRAGSIRSIAFDRRIDWSEFAVVTAADIPGKNHIQLIVADQPCLADGKVNHCEEPILLLAHPDKHKLREAVAAVHIEYEPLPPVFTIEESERAGRDCVGRGQSAQELSA